MDKDTILLLISAICGQTIYNDHIDSNVGRRDILERYSTESLELLAKPKARHERRDVTIEDLSSEAQSFVGNMASLVEREMRTVTIEGQKLGDFFWEENESARKSGKQEDQCRVGTRIRRRGGSISFEWYRNYFLSTGPGKTKKQILSKWIKQKAKGMYSMNAFKKEPLWAQEIIERIEARYVILRKRNTALKRIRMALAEYEKLVEETHRM